MRPTTEATVGTTLMVEPKEKANAVVTPLYASTARVTVSVV
jgi:hypothetical protein